jgi:hypothetical protein
VIWGVKKFSEVKKVPLSGTREVTDERWRLAGD